MGLIKAIAGAAGGVMADQWKEFFTCEALPADVLCCFIVFVPLFHDS